MAPGEDEFDESELFGEQAETAREATPSESGEEEAEEAQGRKRGASSSSSSDAEYDEQLEQNIKAFRGPGASLEGLPIASGSLRGRPRSRQGSAGGERDPVQSKLGTSMPINIPMMAARKLRAADEEEPPDRAATFVPPHLLEQPSVRASASLSSSVAKRERLLQRNAILRRTGFIESGARGTGALPELLDQLAGQRHMTPIKESHLEPSALSAALGSPNGKPPP